MGGRKGRGAGGREKETMGVGGDWGMPDWPGPGEGPPEVRERDERLWRTHSTGVFRGILAVRGAAGARASGKGT